MLAATLPALVYYDYLLAAVNLQARVDAVSQALTLFGVLRGLVTVNVAVHARYTTQ